MRFICWPVSVGSAAALAVAGCSGESSTRRDEASLRSAIELPFPSTLAFQPNVGQFDPSVLFASHGDGFVAFLTSEGAILRFRSGAPTPLDPTGSASEVVLGFVIKGGAGETPLEEGLVPGLTNYFGESGSSPVTGVASFARVRVPSVYPGTDLVYHGTAEGRLEYDFVVFPSGNPDDIQLEFLGADEIVVEADGSLLIRVESEEVRFTAPYAFQDLTSGRADVAASYVVKDGIVGFVIGEYDETERLVIDPLLLYKAQGSGLIARIALDPDGNPVTAGEGQLLGFDGAIEKRDAATGDLIFRTFVGGSQFDAFRGLAIESSGEIHATGYTESLNLPVRNAAQANYGGGPRDAMVARLSPEGVLLDLTYLGGSQDDQGLDIAVDASGRPHVVGLTYSPDFPTRNPLQPSLAGFADGFVTAISTTAGEIAFSTFFGGSREDWPAAIELDSEGAIYFAGRGSSQDYPVLNAFQPTRAFGQTQGFLTKLAPEASAIVYSTYFGSGACNSDEGIEDLTLAPDGSAVVTGFTGCPSGFPVKNAIQPLPAGGRDAFLTRFTPDGQSLEYSTYLGGSGADFGDGLALDTAENPYVVGRTSSSDFPLHDPLPTATDGSDGFILRLDARASSYTYSTYLASASIAVRPIDVERTFVSEGSRLLLVGTVETRILSGPPAHSNDPTSVFTFDSVPPSTSFDCFVDGTPYPGCSSPFSVSSGDGEHTFSVAAAEPLRDPSPAVHTWTLDTSPPDTAIVAGPETTTEEPVVTFAFTGTPASLVAGFECALDGSPFSPCASPIGLGPLELGPHVFSVRAVGNDGRSDATPAERAFSIVPNAPPVLTLVTPGDGSSHATSPTVVTISASEPCIVTSSNVFPPGSALPAGDTTVSLELSGGYNTFSTFAQDAKGLSSLFSFHLFLDDESPRVTFISPPDGGATPRTPANVLLSVDEDVTVLESTPGFLATGPLAGGQRTLSLALASGPNVFNATLRDEAGNTADVVYRLTLDSVRPPPPSIAAPAENAFVEGNEAEVRGVAGGNATQVRITGSSSETVAVIAGQWVGRVKVPSGASRVRAVALSAAGADSDETSVAITAGGTRRIAIVSGDEQVDMAGTVADAPLVVRVTGLDGNPAAFEPITFTIHSQPESSDASLGDSGSEVTVSTDATGHASTTLKLPTGETDAEGLLTETVIVARPRFLDGPPAIFWAQGLVPTRFATPGSPARLVALGQDCSTRPGRPVGSCPLGPAGQPGEGFAALVLDAEGRVVPGARVLFARSTADAKFGSLNSNSAISDPGGIARSGPFTPSPSVQNNTFHVMLREEDLAATAIRENRAEASLPDVFPTPPRVHFSAFAHAGPPARFEGTGGNAANSIPDFLSRGEALDSRVVDQFGNPVANAEVTYAVTATGDPLDAGARLFRWYPEASTAPRCLGAFPDRSDPCAVETLSVTSFSDGHTWSQLLTGKRAGTRYDVEVRSGEAIAVESRTTRSEVGMPSRSLWIVSTEAARNAVLRTENGDADLVGVAVSAVSCDRAADGTGCAGLFTSSRVAGDRLMLDVADNAASFNPPSGVTGAVPPLAGFHPPIGPLELGALLVGGEQARNLEFRIATEWTSQELFGDQRQPRISLQIAPVVPECALAPKITVNSLCADVTPTTTCRGSVSGLGVYVDLANNYSENQVLVFRAEHASGVRAGEPVTKFASTLEIRTADATGFSYFDQSQLEAGADGIPGFFLPDSSVRLENGEDGPTSFRLDFEEPNRGCRELIAKSFMRRGPLTDATVTVPPPGPFVVADPGTGATLLQTSLGGWVDLISRARGGPRTGARRENGVMDWVEMRAWDVYERKGKFNFSIGSDGEPIPTSGDNPVVTKDVRLFDDEVRDVIDSVSRVQSVLIPDTDKRAPDGSNEYHFDFFDGCEYELQMHIEFNAYHPEMRTDAPDERAKYEGIVFSTQNLFLHAAMHEARHNWQWLQATRAQKNLGFSNDEPIGRDLAPDNNDDLFFCEAGPDGDQVVTKSDQDGTQLPIIDCLPEKVLLFSNGRNVSDGLGAARWLVDSPSNPEFPDLRGEKGGGLAESLEADTCAPREGEGRPYATLAREHDAVRFGRAIEAARRRRSP